MQISDIAHALTGPIAGVGGIAFILLSSELLWYLRLFKNSEIPRKLVHILTGVYIAFWPLLMSFAWIQILSILLLGAVYVSKKWHIFRSIHAVKRVTYGELLFPLGVLVAATFAHSGWVYLAAVLHLSLADGLAALVGVRYVKKYGYKVFGQLKTVVGTIVFLATSLGIIMATMLLDPAAYGSSVLIVLLLLPLCTTVIENVGVYGVDNILVPAVVVTILNSLRAIG